MDSSLEFVTCNLELGFKSQVSDDKFATGRIRPLVDSKLEKKTGAVKVQDET